MKQRTISLLVLTLLNLYACKSKIDTYHLSQAEMGRLLMDVHTAEVYSTLVLRDSTHRGNIKDMDSLAGYYKDIFAHYHITKEQFDESMQWYRQHPEKLDSVYNKMLPEMSRMEGTFKAKK